MTPQSSETVWRFEDLLFFLGAVLPSVVLSSLITSSIASPAARGLAYQCALYILMASVLYVLARIRYGVPFSKAVNWTLQFQGAWYLVFGAPVLSLATSVLSVLMGARLVPSAVDSLTASDIPLAVVAVFAVILGPLWEELVFRGFLQPLLQRHSPWLGLIVSSALFSLLHGTQNEWLWQYLLLLFLVGIVFGVVRQRTGSTAASFLMHMAFNLTSLTGSILARG